MRPTHLLAALLAAASVVACSDAGGPNLTGINPVSILDVTVIPGVDTLFVPDTISGGEQLTLVAIVETRAGPRTDLPIAWSSSEPSVATVDDKGLVTARGYGTTVISASASRVGTARVTVAPMFEADTLSNVLVSVSGGDAFSCGLTERDRVYCWGRNSVGQLGGLQPDTVCVNEYLNRDEEPCALIPVRAAGGPYLQVASGDEHACAIRVDGRAFCWGSGVDGRLGNGTTADRAEPTLVSGAHRFVSVTTGGKHSCALTAAGSAWCWGLDTLGQLGNTLPASSTTPIPVDGGRAFQAISAGWLHTCGITTEGEALCWGSDTAQQLGNGSEGGSLTPVAVQTGLRFTAISAGRDHSCALAAGGQLYCWGAGADGRLTGTESLNMATPVQVPGIWTRVAAGGSHTCAASSNGVSCWGRYNLGRLGKEGVAAGSTSITTVLSEAVTTLTAGERHACAVLAAGGTRCWGSNVMGAFGDGLQALLRRTPVAVRPLS